MLAQGTSFIPASMAKRLLTSAGITGKSFARTRQSLTKESLIQKECAGPTGGMTAASSQALKPALTRRKGIAAGLEQSILRKNAIPLQSQASDSGLERMLQCAARQTRTVLDFPIQFPGVTARCFIVRGWVTAAITGTSQMWLQKVAGAILMTLTGSRAGFIGQLV